MSLPTADQSPTTIDIVGGVVDRLSDDRTFSSMQALVDAIAEQAGALALIVGLANDGHGRVAQWAAGSPWPSDLLGSLFDVALVDCDDLRRLGLSDQATHEAELPVALRPIVAEREDAEVAVMAVVAPGSVDRAQSWLVVVGPSVDRRELSRAVRTACLLQSLTDRVDSYSSSVLLAQVETSVRLDEVETSHRLVDGIGATLGHDVRDSLRNVMGWSRLAGAVDIGESVRLEMVQKIQRAATQASAGVGDVLESVHDGQTERLEQSAVDLNGVMKWVTDILDHRIESSRASVISDTLPTVTASPTTIRLALLELVRNSLDHGGRLVQVIVSSTVRNGEVELRVSDNGPGMDEVSRENAFHPGYSTGVGTGYGLNRVSEVLVMAGGRVWFDDSDKGTVAVISLPQSMDKSQHLDA